MEEIRSPQPEPLKDILIRAEQLPPFPDVVQKVMPMLQRMAPVEEIEDVIRFDPVIAARVLALARSPHYARREPVNSLREAIIALGQKALIEVILAACASRFQDGEIKGYDLREGELWEHAVGTAIMADRIASETGRPSALSLYTAGLLHDIGKTVLHFFVQDYFVSIFSAVKNRRLRFLEAEHEVLGIDHQELGAKIAQRWNFPEEVISGIAHHHNPLEADHYQEQAAILYVANRMVAAMGIGAGVDGFLNPNQDEVFDQLKIDARMVERLMADVFVALEETKQFLKT